MEISKLTLGACFTNVYIISSSHNNAVLIDPADEADTIIKTIEASGLTLKYIILTHGHTDHILALEEVRDHFRVPVLVGKQDAERLLDADLINDRPYVKAPYHAVQPDILITEESEVWLDELRFSFYAMPGHTDGSVCVVVGDIIFTGDTLMYEKLGRTDLYGGDKERLVRSVKRLMRDFKDYCRILPGHGAETTVRHERECNPFLVK